jgi:hypothetical protein
LHANDYHKRIAHRQGHAEAAGNALQVILQAAALWTAAAAIVWQRAGKDKAITR